MKLTHSSALHSRAIAVIFLSAFSGFIISYAILRLNLAETKSRSSELIIKTDDRTGNHLTVMPGDSLPQVPLSETTSGSVKPVNIEKKDILFNQNPSFLVWTTLVLVMMTIVAGVFPAFVWECKGLYRTFQLNEKNVRMIIFQTIILCLFLFVLPATLNFYKPVSIIRDFHILLSNHYIIHLFVLLPLLLLVPVFSAIFMIGPSADKINYAGGDKESIESASLKFNRLNRILQNSLQILAVIVVITVLLSSALRQSIKAALSTAGFDLFPKEIVYVYGLYFSLFLALIYLPAAVYLRYKTTGFKTALLSDKKLNTETNKDWMLAVTMNLGLDKSAIDNLKVVLTVLSPLITSFLPEQLHLF
jgi:hypothetical protein